MLSYLNQNVCRCCLLEQPPLSYSLHENSLARDLCELVPGLHVAIHGDDLPQVICELCLRRMREAIEFRRCCLETQQLLRQRQEQVWHTVEANFDDVLACIEREVCRLEQEESSIGMSDKCNVIEELNLDVSLPATQQTCGFDSLDFDELLPQPEEIDECMLSSPGEPAIELDELVARIYNEQISGTTSVNTSPPIASNNTPTVKPVMPEPSPQRRMLCHVNQKSTHKSLKEYRMRHPCSECDKKFTRNFQLKLHMISVHGLGDGLRYQCDECHKTFASRHSLHYHFKSTHSEERPFECEHCKRSFVLRTQLSSHLRVHTGESKPRIFECSKCSKTWPTRSGLRTHMRTHDPAQERPFKCDRCEKSFFTRGHLQSHILVHTGEKPFVCPFCEKSYQCVGNLNNHIMRHHSGVLAMQNGKSVLLEC